MHAVCVSILCPVIAMSIENALVVNENNHVIEQDCRQTTKKQYLMHVWHTSHIGVHDHTFQAPCFVKVFVWNSLCEPMPEPCAGLCYSQTKNRMALYDPIYLGNKIHIDILPTARDDSKLRTCNTDSQNMRTPQHCHSILCLHVQNPMRMTRRKPQHETTNATVHARPLQRKRPSNE